MLKRKGFHEKNAIGMFAEDKGKKFEDFALRTDDMSACVRVCMRALAPHET